MATSILSRFSPNQSATINSLYNAWHASPYSDNPNVLYQAIGIANGEGNNTAGSNGFPGMLPSDSNADGAGRTAYGPFQYNYNPNGGSLGNTISSYYGVSNPGQLSIDQQSEFTINTIGSGSNGGVGNWMSVGDSGGIGNITNAGQATFNNAQSQGIITGGSVGIGGDYVTINHNGLPEDMTLDSNGGSGSTGASTADQYSGFGSLGSQPTNVPGSQVNSPALGVGDTSWTGNTADTPTGSTAAPANSGNPVQPTAAAGTGASASTAPQTGAKDTSKSGTPETITNISNAGSVAADTVSKALGGVTQGAAADTKAATTAGTGWLNSLFGEGTDLLARGGFILLGLVLLIGAFVFFYVDSKTSQTS